MNHKNYKKWPSKCSLGQDNIFKCLVLTNQQTQKYYIYGHIRQGKAANLTSDKLKLRDIWHFCLKND